jgi:hypothetical protein
MKFKKLVGVMDIIINTLKERDFDEWKVFTKDSTGKYRIWKQHFFRSLRLWIGFRFVG